MSVEMALSLLVLGGLVGHYGMHAREHGAIFTAYGLGVLAVVAILAAAGALAIQALEVLR